MHKKRIYILILFLFILVSVQAELAKFGVPNIIHYSKHEYKGGTQNWSITQDMHGLMYFANNSGLLIFDGFKWQLEKMPNSSIVRSVYAAKSGDIYVGAFNELGKLKVLRNGKMEYYSLKKYIPAAYLGFDDIWNITAFQDQIVYQSYNFAFLFKNDSVVSVLKAPSRFQNSFKVNDHLYFNDMDKGLLEYRSGELHALPGCESLSGEEIGAVLSFGSENELMICTFNKGIYIYNGIELKRWNVAVNALIQKSQIYCAGIFQNNFLAIGTIQDGLYILDQDGTVIQHINRMNGLQNNTVLNLFSDRDFNLWLGLDNGIDYLNTNSPISFIKPADKIGAGYTSIIFKGKIYFGTNQGLFVENWDKSQSAGNLKLIPGTEGQVWHLGIYEDKLLCGHTNGTYAIEGETAKQICHVPGAWKFISPKRFPGYLIGGNYDGLTVFKNQNGEWVYIGKIKGFNESFRVFEEDENGDIWMSHGFKGIYKIELGSSLDQIKSSRFFSTTDGLPANYNIGVIKIKDHILFTSNSGIFEYNPKTNRIESSTFFNQLFHPLKDFTYLKEDRDGNIWYNSKQSGENRTGVFRILDDRSYKNVSAPFALLNDKFINGFEFIYQNTEGDIFFGIEGGFASYSPNDNLQHSSEFTTFINRATALYLDSTFFYGNFFIGSEKKNKLNYEFPFKNNTFRISYTSPSFDNQANIEFSYILSNYTEKWSDWSNTPFCEFTKLPPGDYVFRVKARNQMGIESKSDSLQFKINPPWYKSDYAYLFYFLLFGCFVYLIIWIVLKRLEISKRKERIKNLKAYREKELEYKRQALLNEQKIINLKNEKLKIEMIHRDKELANQTMDLIRKNKFLAKITEDLEKLKKLNDDTALKAKVSSLITKINKDIDHEKQWEIFETAFEEVHEDFLIRLKTKYPTLSPKELKLCTYLRLNISTKEIAPLMNISIRGVEICRYRVRKKLDIARDESLTKMIIDL